MPGPLSRPDGIKETTAQKAARANSDKVVVTGRTAKKRSKRRNTEEE